VDKDGNRSEEVYNSGNRKEGKPFILKRHEKEMWKLLNAKELPTWVPDAERDSCVKCSTPFSTFNRRHHCRHCGNIFCSDCSSKEIAVPRIGITTPARICDECYIEVRSYAAEYKTLHEMGL